MDILAILISLGLMMYLAYRGVSVLILAPVLAILAVVLSGVGHQSMGIYTQVFMQGMGNFAMKFFPIFLLGAIFGKLMEDSGYAQAIAKILVDKLGQQHALLSVILACGILTYGGVSVFVIAFAIYPIASALFKQVNIPKRLIPGAISVGGLTFTMTALPGTPSIHNAIPMPYFHTDAFAAPILGLVASAVMLGGGYWWMSREKKLALKNNEGYGNHTLNENPVRIEGKLPSLWEALAPIVIVIVGNYIFSKKVIPMWDVAYLAEKKFGGVSLSAVSGMWAIIISLVLACVFVVVMNLKRWKNLNDTMNQGAMGSLLPIFNTASEVGYGSVIAMLAGFATVKHFLTNLAPNNPLISEAIMINIIAGITGSASGGLGISLEMMGKTYYDMALQHGIDPELMHRVASIASGGLDALPHNGAVITMLAICGLTHKDSYKDVFVTAVVMPILALVVVIVLGTMFGSF